MHIVGVIANVKFYGAREPATATFYVYDPKAAFASVLIRLRPGTIPQTLSFIDRTWHAFAPTKAINRWFLDDVVGRQYQADERQGDLFDVFVVIAVFISCLGLLGLSAFSIVQRTREIGIRKVLGASASAIITLLTRDFIKLVAIAFLIAVPVAWYIMSQWLNEFAYRTGISWWLFALAGISAVMVTLLTVGIQAYRAAMANPVKSIGTE